MRRFRDDLLSVPPAERDAWVDRRFGLDAIPDDEALPRGCVPYLPCPVDALLRAADQAGVDDSDVFVDVGSGVGRAALFVHLVTGAAAIGLEIQPALVRASRDLARRLRVARFTAIEGDAVPLAAEAGAGTVFFLYCPFSGDRLERFLGELELVARKKPIRLCCVDVPVPARPWLTLAAPPSGDLAVYRSVSRS